jgi:dTDP-4-dehydrorhamnose reductase
MTYLLAGSAGLLGGFVLRELGDGCTGMDLPELDITSAASVRAAVDAVSPDCIVNCAAMTDVDGCERDPLGALSLHGTGVANLTGTGVRLVTVSTDQVFDSDSPEPLLEDASPAGPPVNEYARSKLAGERIALGVPGNAVVRTSWLFGRDRGMVPGFWRELSKGGTVRAVSDQTSSITYARDLAASIAAIARNGGTGIFHRVNRGALSPLDVARRLREMAGCGEVLPVTWADLALDAPRPRCSVLGTSRGDPLPDAWDAVERWMRKNV